MTRVEVTSFASGVIKPRLYGRTDTEGYAQALREAVNFIVCPDCGITKRPGTQVIRALQTSNVRLESFVDDEGDNYIIEAGYDTEGFVKFHTQTATGGRVTGTPWSSAALLKSTHFVNENGRLYMANPTNGMSYIEMGVSDLTISTDTYYPIDPDGKVTKESATELRTDNTGGEFQFYATDIGQTIVIVISTDIYTATIKSVLENEYDSSVTPEPDYYYSKITISTPTAQGASAAWSTHPDDTVISYLGIAPFNPYDSGFKPGTLCFACGRAYISRFSSDKRKIYGSKVGEYTNFRLGPADDFALEFTLTDIYGGEIRWLYGGKQLIVGTDTGVLTVTAEGGLGATSVPIVVKQSDIGVSEIRPELLGDIYTYPQKTLDGIRVFQYQTESDQYSTPELTSFASHLFDSDIADITIVRHPFPIYIATQEDGTAVFITYDFASKTIAATSQEFSGTLHSVSVVRGASDDEIYMAITNGSSTTLQKMDPIYFEGNLGDGVFVEAGTVITGSEGNITSVAAANPGTITLSDGTGFSNGDYVRLTDVSTGDSDLDAFLEATDFLLANKSTDTFDLHDLDDAAIDLSGYSPVSVTGTIHVVFSDVTGLSDYEGDTVETVGDGISYGTDVVSSGQVTIASRVHEAIVGYPYSAYIRLLPPLITPEVWKRLVRIGLNVYKTRGLHAGGSVASWEELTFDDEIIVDTQDDLATGIKRFPYISSYDNDVDTYIGTDEAYPATILCLYLYYDVEEG